MNNKMILKMSKTQLVETISSFPFHYQPQWLKKGNKDELAGFLMSAILIPALSEYQVYSDNLPVQIGWSIDKKYIRVVYDNSPYSQEDIQFKHLTFKVII